jgi:hypothetical protein
MMAVSVGGTGTEPKLSAPRALFTSSFQGNGDVSPDGRFLLLAPTPRQSTARVIQLVLNWFDDVRAKTSPR